MEVKTGVIATAGSGTRMLPVTLGYPKELLPVSISTTQGGQPALQLIIDEYITAGITRIIIITGENPAPLYRQYDLSNVPARGKHKAVVFSFNTRNWNNYPDAGVLVLFSETDVPEYVTPETLKDYGWEISPEEWQNPSPLFGLKRPFDGTWE